jgi:hypothetical protein
VLQGLEAQAQGQLGAQFPADLVRCTLFARACDPVVDMLESSGQYTDARILDWVLASTFDGLAAARKPGKSGH